MEDGINFVDERRRRRRRRRLFTIFVTIINFWKSTRSTLVSRKCNESISVFLPLQTRYDFISVFSFFFFLVIYNQWTIESMLKINLIMQLSCVRDMKKKEKKLLFRYSRFYQLWLCGDKFSFSMQTLQSWILSVHGV